jgi:hypothetical protein
VWSLSRGGHVYTRWYVVTSKLTTVLGLGYLSCALCAFSVCVFVYVFGGEGIACVAHNALDYFMNSEIRFCHSRYISDH